MDLSTEIEFWVGFVHAAIELNSWEDMHRANMEIEKALWKDLENW